MRGVLLLACLVPAWAAAAADPLIPAHIRRLIDSRDYDRAIPAIEQQLASSPAWDTGQVLLAQIWAARGDYRRAADASMAALKIRESPDALMLGAIARMHLNELNASIELLDRAVRIRPKDARIYKILGMDYTLGGMHGEARKAFERAQALNPQDGEAHYFAGRALYELLDFAGARRALLRSAELDPASVRTFAALGQVDEKLQDLAGAERSYRRAVELCNGRGAECAWPLLELGLLMKRLSGDEKAELLLRQAIETRAGWAKPHFFLGKLLATRGDLAGARAEFETAVKLDGTRSEYHYQLGLLYRRAGEHEAAERHMARFREISRVGEPAERDAGLTLP